MSRHWTFMYTKDALKDKKRAYEAGFKNKIEQLLEMLEENPYDTYLPLELVGDMIGAYSRRINHQHRLVYAVYESEKKVKIISMWNHHE